VSPALARRAAAGRGSRRSPGEARRGLLERAHHEDGSSAITTVFGVLIFLGFLMLATQVLVHLYATSTVSAVAFDTARRAAAQGADCDSIEASQHVRRALGGYGDRIDEPLCTSDATQTVVTITGPTPARMVDAFGGGLGLDRIERTARVRTEDFQAVDP
jgi:hypothetical protein